MMILAITDQFRDEATAVHVGRAERLLPQLHDPYTRAYYAALIHERRARAAIDAGRATMAYEWLRAALEGFDRAIGLRPAGNDDAVLRWNACVRALDAGPGAERSRPRGVRDHVGIATDVVCRTSCVGPSFSSGNRSPELLRRRSSIRHRSRR